MLLATCLLLPSGLARPWMVTSDPPATRADNLVKAMNLTEKLNLFHGSCGGYVGNVCGNARLGIPQIKMNDGPQGFRDNKHPGSSTAWPCSLAIAATFDPTAAMAWGKGMGDEFYRKGSNVQLGPGMCVARVPRNGRNFEYISGEDPHLGSALVGQAIEGIQSQGVIANAKHWVENNQETDRTSVNELVDERTRFEIYYPPFEAAIKANVGSFMCSYNKINGFWSCENPTTLADLKERLGFKGWVMSDWGATHSMSLMQGLDQEMPGAGHMSNKGISAALEKGDVTQARIDDGAKRVLTPLFAVGAFDKANNNTQENNVTTVASVALARKLAAQSIVLLKNEKVLPLRTGKPLTIALIGKTALHPVVHGGGSGSVVPAYVPTPFDVIRAKLHLPGRPPPAPANCSGRKWDVGVDYRNTDGQTQAPATSVDECCDLCAKRTSPSLCSTFTYVSADKMCWMKTSDHNHVKDGGATSGVCRETPLPPPCDAAGTTCAYYDDGTDVSRASQLAATVDVAIIFVSTSSSEGGDRSSLSFDDNADELVISIASAAKKSVVVGVAPGAVLTPWRASIDALTLGFMPGQEYANGLLDVLFGEYNPSAKLPLSLPNYENEVNFSHSMWPGDKNASGRVSVYSEKLQVGYRWYHAHGVAPAFAFGFGLSYTTFGLSSLKVSGTGVTCDVQNKGQLAGGAVVQLYLTFPTSAGEPPRQLKRFERVELSPSGTHSVAFTLEDRDFSTWDPTTHAWRKVTGKFGVSVGQSSDDAEALVGEIVV